MAQKAVLREAVYTRALRASQHVKRAEVWVGARCTLWVGGAWASVRRVRESNPAPWLLRAVKPAESPPRPSDGRNAAMNCGCVVFSFGPARFQTGLLEQLYRGYITTAEYTQNNCDLLEAPSGYEGDQLRLKARAPVYKLAWGSTRLSNARVEFSMEIDLLRSPFFAVCSLVREI
jgi:hypothetical protein